MDNKALTDALEICKKCVNTKCDGMNCEYIRNYWNLYINRDNISSTLASKENKQYASYYAMLTQSNMKLSGVNKKLKDENIILKTEVKRLKELSVRKNIMSSIR